MTDRCGRARRLVVAVLVLTTVAAGCTSDDDAGDSDETTEATESVTEDTLDILVTNDDGFDAEGIDVLVTQLQALPDVNVTVVAPADQRSGSGSNTTEGELATEERETAGGYPATAVDGFPADTVRVAIDDLGLEPDLVVSGINEGQNVGPAVDLSGTIGAARAAAQRGIPAVAVSQGRGAEGQELDYEASAQLVVDWITENRDRLSPTPGQPQPFVLNFNAPSCAVGEVRGLAPVPPAEGVDLGAALQPTDQCGESSLPAPLIDDVQALSDGFATESEIPVTPTP